MTGRLRKICNPAMKYVLCYGNLKSVIIDNQKWEIPMSLVTEYKGAAAEPVENVIRNSLDEFGKKIGVQPIEGGDFISVDGESYQNRGVSDTIEHFHTFDDDPKKYYDERTPLIGTYCQNNNTVAFVSPDGVLHVGPATPSNMKLLENAGYKADYFFVPMSRGEHFVQPDTAEEYQEIWDKAQLECKQLSLENFKQQCSEQARSVGVHGRTSEILSQDDVCFMKVDGIVYAGGPSDKIDVIPNSNHPSEAYMRPKKAGKYSNNNGVLAFIDPEGVMYVGQDTSENQSALQASGYQKGGFLVPFSNGEHAVSWSTQLDHTQKKLLALDQKLIGDMQTILGRERNPGDIISWYNQMFETKNMTTDKIFPENNG